MKTKERLRTKVWWPMMDKDMKKCVRSYHQCRIVSQPSAPEPILYKKFEDGPWEDLVVVSF